MKKYISSGKFLLIILLFIFGVSVSPFFIPVAYAFVGGDGSSGNPYQITTCAELQAMSGSLASSYILNNDIDCGVAPYNTGFTPVGDSNTPFIGTFNGNHKVISGLYVNVGSYGGLFGYINGAGATVSNVTLVNENINSSSYAGGVVGHNNAGGINNVHTTGSITANSYAGGIVGDNFASATITNSSSSDTVNCTLDAGGIAGRNVGSSSITTSFATGNVSGFQNIAGLVGYDQGGTITNAYATGQVSGVISVGGLVGDGSQSTINKTYSIGDVIGQGFGSDMYIGGLIGYTANGGATFSNSFSASRVLFNTGSGTRVTPYSGDRYIGNFVGGSSSDTFTNDFYDGATGGQAFCLGNGTFGGQGGTNPVGCTDAASGLSYFKGNNTNAPLNAWNFSTVWHTVASAFPGLFLAPTQGAISLISKDSFSASLSGNVTSVGSENLFVRGFNYGIDTNYGNSTSEIGSFSTGPFSAKLTGLICSDTYHYQSYSTNFAGTAVSSDGTFTTNPCAVGGAPLTTDADIQLIPKIQNDTQAQPSNNISASVISAVGSGSMSLSNNDTTVVAPVSASIVVASSLPTRAIYSLGNTKLKLGSKGDAVKELERFLNDTYKSNLSLDGKFGKKTLVLIKKWQKENGLVVDGVVGVKSKALINAKK